MPLDITGSSQTNPGTFTKRTFADVRGVIGIDTGLTPSRRQNFNWALGQVELGCRCGLAQLPATPETVDEIVRRLRHNPAGRKASSISNIGSLLRRMLRCYPAANEPAPARSARPVSPEWEALLLRVPDPADLIVLRIFARWATSIGLAPDAVTADCLAPYAEATAGRVKHPKIHLRKLRAAWNRAAGRVPGWPNVEMLAPERREALSLAWNAIHPALQGQLEAYFQRRRGTPRIRMRGAAPLPPLRPISEAKSRQNIRLFLGALRDAGQDSTRIASVAELLDLDRVDLGLGQLQQRRRGETGTQAANVAATLCALAKGTSNYSAADLAELRAMHKALRPKYDGMVQSKRARLELILDPKAHASLLAYPYRLFEKAGKIGGKRGARLARTALAIEMFLVSCLRIKNVCELDIKRSFVSGADRSTFLIVYSDDVKNVEPRQLRLPKETADLLQRYIAVHRPRLGRAGETSALFAGEAPGSHLNDGTLRQQIERMIKADLGLDVKPHDFRALAVMAYLQRNPGDFATAQHILGHRRLDTLLKHYAWLDGEKAYRAYHDHVLRGRTAHVPLTVRKGGGCRHGGRR